MSKNDSRKKIGKTLKIIRESRGISKSDFEDATKLAFNQISAIENGSINFTMDSLLEYMSALNYSINFDDNEVH